jgi:hypothetical protein
MGHLLPLHFAAGILRVLLLTRILFRMFASFRIAYRSLKLW